jgi:hypothetical protein
MMKVVAARDIRRGDIIAEGLVFLAEPDARYGIVLSVALGQVHAKPGQKVIRFARLTNSDVRRVEAMTAERP